MQPAVSLEESPSNGSQSTGMSPNQRRSQNQRRFLQESGLLTERVLAVLDCMRENDIDLINILWAISWNVEGLSGHPSVVLNRTSVLISDDLPQILHKWLNPPRSHASGARTKAIRENIKAWALETVLETLDGELKCLKKVMKSKPSELTEAALLDIKLQDMIDEVSTTAPVLWKTLRHVAYTPLQDIRNTMKNPDPVSYLSYFISCINMKIIDCPYDDLDGRLLAISAQL
jgi:hypothetical protein